MKKLFLFVAVFVSVFEVVAQINGPVQNLEIVTDENDKILLTWDFPEEVNKGEITITWSSMVIDGWTGAAPTCAWDIASRFDTLDIRNLIGWRVKNITCVTPVLSPYYPQPEDVEFHVKVWQGTPENLTLLCDQLIENPTPGELKTVDLNETVWVERGGDLFIGLYGNAEMSFPWAADANPPAPDSKSCYFNLYTTSDCLPSQWEMGYFLNFCLSATLVSPEEDKKHDNGQNNLTGYRIYRNGSLIKEIPYPFMTYFNDSDYTKENEVSYCVSAMYDDEESETVCATTTVTGIVEDETTQRLSIHPNPSSDMFIVEGIEPVEIKVYNTLGQLMKTFRNTNEASLEGLPQGVYQLRVTDKDGYIFTEKVVKN